MPPTRPTIDAAEGAFGPAATRICYSDDHHRSHDEFCRSPAFAQYKANAVWNIVAQEFGLHVIPDAIVPPLGSHCITACRKQLRVALMNDPETTPDIGALMSASTHHPL